MRDFADFFYGSVNAFLDEWVEISIDEKTSEIHMLMYSIEFTHWYDNCITLLLVDPFCQSETCTCLLGLVWFKDYSAFRGFHNIWSVDPSCTTPITILNCIFFRKFTVSAVRNRQVTLIICWQMWFSRWNCEIKFFYAMTDFEVAYLLLIVIGASQNIFKRVYNDLYRRN